MVEAYLGAIFVDSKFDYTVIETFFEKHIKPYFHDMSVYDTFANKHPTVRPTSPRISKELHSRLTNHHLP